MEIVTGIADGDLRQPVEDTFEALYRNDRRWWEVRGGNNDPFDSAEECLRAPRALVELHQLGAEPLSVARRGPPVRR
jgi:hypothetical protein